MPLYQQMELWGRWLPTGEWKSGGNWNLEVSSVEAEFRARVECDGEGCGRERWEPGGVRWEDPARVGQTHERQERWILEASGYKPWAVAVQVRGASDKNIRW